MTTAAPAHQPPSAHTMNYFVRRSSQEFGPYTERDLQQMAASHQLRGDSKMRRVDSDVWFPAKEIPWLFSDKSWAAAFVLSFFLGALGADRFYLGYTGIGVAKLLTIGGLGIWALVDTIRIALHLIPDVDGRALA